MSEQVNDSADVIDNTGASRFELPADGWLAELVYHIRGDRLVLIHTEVPVELEGRGIGGRLVTAAIDRAVRERTDPGAVVPVRPRLAGAASRGGEQGGHRLGQLSSSRTRGTTWRPYSSMLLMS